MDKEIGRISQLYRYPVKSMAGMNLDIATLGWHGIEGDRRFAIRRMADSGGFPWLSASKLPQLILYRPFVKTGSDPQTPTHVITPDGTELELRGKELQEELSRKHGGEVQIMQLKQGIFDEAPVSVICPATILAIERESGRPLDLRRFRPNLVIETSNDQPFQEDGWVGKSLMFGDREDAPVVSITLRDLRCVMINLDPETAASDANIMKAAVRLNENYAGAYGTVIRAGQIETGDKVFLREE